DSLPHKNEVTQSIPMGRIGTVDEIAKTTVFLLSDGAGYITGQSLVVDGGVTRHV
ncbi:MAG TPA: SDR family oxidoreductase, partial [Planctomycetes bacterium]|nr:SDR family oxidoreductase [Planctomycetota bacterium]